MNKPSSMNLNQIDPATDVHSAVSGACMVVIPAFNEAGSIAKVISKVPRELPGFARVSILVVNDGSRDDTVKVAFAAGADYVYSSPRNQGLGAAVLFGLKQAYQLGAEAAVMIDADNEYPAEQIPELVQPIVNGQADYVLGSRFLKTVQGMKAYRRIGNRVFTWLQAKLLRLELTDGQTGMRAFKREVLRDLDIIHAYNYAQVMTLNIVRQNYLLQEIAIDYQVRTEGASFINWTYIHKVIPAIIRELTTAPSGRVSRVQTRYDRLPHKIGYPANQK
ncbi:glycosyltransferase family 2 protein [Marinicrinis sediminis]|uniref:Glycosyltransferase family 2 protein n=1 Tax=Marinicrinis sediminis TaxID=1652465 RepID=A0ABW5R9A6_9BACL